MASPERIRNRKDLPLISEMVSWEPAIKTIIQEKTNTTQVLRAVTTSESASRMPHLARIAVIPANSADSIANKIHISFTQLS